MKLEWYAVIFSLAGELVLSVGNPDIVYLTYLSYMIANVMWITLGFRWKKKSLICLNICFFSIGIVGLIRWL